MPNPQWPLFDLRVKTERLELRPPSDEDLFAMIGLARKGVHAPEVMPFVIPWTRLESPQFERSALQHHWGARADWSPQNWGVSLAVVHEGRVVGSQSVRGEEFAIRRNIDTGSWLGQEFHGKGFGKEMRAAVLFLGFEGLGALDATTNAFSDNPASIGVTTGLNYEPNGALSKAVEGKRVEVLHYRLTRERWQEKTRPMYDVTIENLEPCLQMFGVLS